MRLILACLLPSIAAMLAGCAFAAGPRVTNLGEITLHPGVNEIRRLAPDDRSGIIVKSWRDLGHDRFYPVYLVMLPDADAAHGWRVVSFETSGGTQDFIGGAGLDQAAIRFARGKLAGVPQTFLIIATLAGATPSPATTTIYRLAGGREDYFAPISSTTTTRLYCNADMALRETLKLPLPGGYAGPMTSDGCVKQG